MIHLNCANGESRVTCAYSHINSLWVRLELLLGGTLFETPEQQLLEKNALDHFLCDESSLCVLFIYSSTRRS
jgi:hypothetical protein